MKDNYFAQSSADADDKLLFAAKMRGIVPLRCLLGGEAVWRVTSDGLKPCDTCNGPRERCHGTPRKDTGDGTRKRINPRG